MALSTKAKMVVPFTREQQGQPALSAERYTLVDIMRASTSMPPLPVQTNEFISIAATVMSKVAAGTMTLVAAGSYTQLQVRGFSICNEGTNSRRFELRFGTTPIWKGYVKAGLPFNWNYIGAYPRSQEDKPLVAYISGAGTASITVNYKEL